MLEETELEVSNDIPFGMVFKIIKYMAERLIALDLIHVTRAQLGLYSVPENYPLNYVHKVALWGEHSTVHTRERGGK